MSKVGTALTKEICIICCKEQDGAIVINQVLTERHAKAVEKMHGKVVGFAEEPCDKCKEDMEKAFLFVGFDEEQSDMENMPLGMHRTGHIVGVKKDIPLVQEWVKQQVPNAIKEGYLFTPHVVMKELNLIQ